MEIASDRCAFHCHLQKVHVSCAQHWHNIVKLCVLFLLYSNVDVTGITQLESSGVPNLEKKSIKGSNIKFQSVNSSFNTIMGNPYSLLNSGFTMKASVPLKKLSEQSSSDDETTFDPQEDLDFSVRYPFNEFYIVYS